MPTFEVTYNVITTYKTTVEAINDMEAMEIVEDEEFCGFVIVEDQETVAIDVEKLED